MGAMDWLKGVMGPQAQFPGQQQGIPGVGGSPLGGLAGLAAPIAGAAFGGGGPLGNPLGGMMGPSFAPPGADPYASQGGPPIGGAPGMGAMVPGGYPTAGDALAANAGYGGGMGNAPGGAPPSHPYAPSMAGSGREAALEAQVAELRHDVEALALFARTLLTVMVDRRILTVEQFQETKNRIDMLDGKLDDRVAKGT